jgi:hypothetical protein
MKCFLGIRFAFVAVLLVLGTATASAQSVQGHAKVSLEPGSQLVSEIGVNAWLDADGVAHGRMVWVGDVAHGTLPKGGLADPWFINVTDLVFDGNTAYVTGTVSHSIFPDDIGTEIRLGFTDNSATGEPDEILAFLPFGIPVEAGNITVRN